MKPFKSANAALALLLVLGLFDAPGAGASARGAKKALWRSVDAHAEDLVAAADGVWAAAEVGLREKISSKILAEVLRKNGFEVEWNISSMPTAFIASYGSGKPVIGFLAEFDALPGLSQKVQPSKEPLAEGDAGHGCGHNLLGAASVGAGVALKEIMHARGVPGTVRVYGTPDEEDTGGKIFMARDGAFDDLDAAVAWHPDLETGINMEGSQAMVDFTVEFSGKTSHAAYDPWSGASALDAAELMAIGINYLREHVRPTVRIHYVFPAAGDVPNIVPERASLWCWVRDSEKPGVDTVFEQVKNIAEGAALMTGTKASLEHGGFCYNLLPNRAIAGAMHDNLKMLPPLSYTEEEITFAKAMQKAADVEEKGMTAEVNPLEELGVPSGGSTDLGDVSWICPTVELNVATAPADVPWHSWCVVAASGSSIGRKGMLYGAKVMAATGYDLLTDPKLLEKAREDFKEMTRGVPYQPLAEGIELPVP
jgi:aminobenzoyl-glutamate utilization protein B